MAALKVKQTQGKRAKDMTAEELRALLPGAQEALVKAEGEVGISDDELQRRAVEAVLSDDGGKRVAELQAKHGESVKKRDAARLTVAGLETVIAEASQREREGEISKVHKQLLDVFARRTAAAREVRAALETLARHQVKVENLGIEALRVAVLVPALNPPSDPALDAAREAGRELRSEIYDGAAASVVASEPNVKRVRRFRLPSYVGQGFRPDQVYEQMSGHLWSEVLCVRRGENVADARHFAQAMVNWQADLLREFEEFHEREHPKLRGDE